MILRVREERNRHRSCGSNDALRIVIRTEVDGAGAGEKAVEYIQRQFFYSAPSLKKGTVGL